MRVSNDSVGNDYVFPDEDDNLTAYAGGNAQFTVPSGLLQSISKCINLYHIEEILSNVISYLLSTLYCYLYSVHI